MALADKADPRLYCFGDVQTRYLLDTLATHVDLECLCDPALLRLRTYDAAHETKLLATVEAYASCSFNLARTARKLYLHRNTLVYRLNKAEEISGKNLRESEDVGELLLTCRTVRHLEGRR